MRNQKLDIKSVLFTILWVLIGMATIVLSVAAVNRQDEKLCKAVAINISAVGTNYFIDKKDILDIVNESAGEKPAGRPITSFNLAQIEKTLKQDVWVEEANLYFDNNDILQASVSERVPVARIFTKSNQTFYIDSAIKMLPLSDKFSARLPVFTGFPSDSKVLSHADSSLMLAIRDISLSLQRDDFLMGMIDQVDITADRTFELSPKIGNQAILFGNGSDIDSKFKKLKLFYKKVITNTGWNKYSLIDLQYKDQVVAKIRGKEEVSADSIKALQLLNFMASTAAMHAADSVRRILQETESNVTDVATIQHSVERDEGPDMTEDNYPMNKPSVAFAPVKTMPRVITVAAVPAIKTTPAKKLVLVKTAPTAKFPVKAARMPIVKKATPVLKPKLPANRVQVSAQTSKQKPKVIMPKKNDY